MFLENDFSFNVGNKEIQRNIKKIAVSLNQQKTQYFICTIETEDKNDI